MYEEAGSKGCHPLFSCFFEELSETLRMLEDPQNTAIKVTVELDRIKK
ncbi:hypothetical protein [Pelosinus propionicus]|uniref:Uncharacterized protein n=1 Tax=Pelosinus propionicus DSM 13327 TaxID=1123291 RepID=A0A1I4HPI1_9FIRM|nr:hypothetical protein [Pelosinus propionicus]SFL43461.1 hypothetical protein SAMN04490355_1004114 [Pelosinus propionicus DSM 13327]